MMQYLVENGVDILYIQNNVIHKINKNNGKKEYQAEFLK